MYIYAHLGLNNNTIFFMLEYLTLLSNNNWSPFPFYEMSLVLMLFSCHSQHPGFINNNQLLFPNDTAVFHVDRKIDLTHPNIDKIEMAPNDTYDYTGSECWITGWGYTGINSIYYIPITYITL